MAAPSFTVNFTDKPPTEPGFYARKPDDSGYTRVGNFLINEETNQLQDLDTGEVADDIGGLWCRLVPAEEVEKAFREPFTFTSPETVDKRWNKSRAKRVSEGKEE